MTAQTNHSLGSLQHGRRATAHPETKLPTPRVTGTNRTIRGYLFRNLRGQVRRPETPSGFRIEQAWSTPTRTTTKSPDRTTMKLLVLKTASTTPRNSQTKKQGCIMIPTHGYAQSVGVSQQDISYTIHNHTNAHILSMLLPVARRSFCWTPMDPRAQPGGFLCNNLRGEPLDQTLTG